MIGYFETSISVGLYSSVSPLARLMNIIGTSLSSAYMILITQLYAKDKFEDMLYIHQKTAKLIFLLTTIPFTVLYLSPEAVINLIFGSKYLAASSVLEILSLGLIVFWIFGLSGTSFVVFRKSNYELIGNVIAIFCNIVLNLILIPRYGIIGAGIATSISYIVNGIIKTILLYKISKLHPFNKKFILSVALFFILIFAVKHLMYISSLAGLIEVAAITSGIYITTLVLLKLIDNDDLNFLKKMIKK
jgi:O-antigen/teichoic acid export membrane protein